MCNQGKRISRQFVLFAEEPFWKDFAPKLDEVPWETHFIYVSNRIYRKLHSTTIALIEITYKIKKLLDEGKYVIGIYLDLTKAFDTVNHEILLYKLWRYRIRGHANDIFRSYLTNRRQHTCTNEKKTIIRTVNCGVPQGSVLGPLIPTLYMNDIVKSVNANKIRLYADDTGVFMHNKNIHNLIKQAK